MGVIMRDDVQYGGGGIAGGTEEIPITIVLTQAQYDALSSAEKSDNTKVYYISDGESGGGSEIDDTTTANNKTWSSNKISTELTNKISTSSTNGLLKNDGTVDTTDYASKTYANNAYILPRASNNEMGGVRFYPYGGFSMYGRYLRDGTWGYYLDLALQRSYIDIFSTLSSTEKSIPSGIKNWYIEIPKSALNSTIENTNFNIWDIFHNGNAMIIGLVFGTSYTYSDDIRTFITDWEVVGPSIDNIRIYYTTCNSSDHTITITKARMTFLYW